MERRKGISESEWEVMEILWEESPVSSRHIIKKLSDVGWKPTTIRTLLGRLVKKGYAAHSEDEYAYSYYPVVQRSEMVKSETDHIIDKLYNGSLSSMLAGFVGKRQLTPDEKSELKKLLEED